MSLSSPSSPGLLFPGMLGISVGGGQILFSNIQVRLLRSGKKLIRGNWKTSLIPIQNVQCTLVGRNTRHKPRHFIFDRLDNTASRDILDAKKVKKYVCQMLPLHFAPESPCTVIAQNGCRATLCPTNCRRYWGNNRKFFWVKDFDMF